MSPESEVDVEVDLRTAFRLAMGQVCTPVSVVTAVHEGRPHGSTVSAFASLSMEPPMVLVSLDRYSDLLALIRSTGAFGVNVLSHDQQDTALRFAVKGEHKFQGLDWVPACGLPRLPGSAVWVACEVAEIVPGGDHDIVLGRVIEVDTTIARPLTYHGRAFGTHDLVTLEAGRV